jgi:hypothetical protein
MTDVSSDLQSKFHANDPFSTVGAANAKHWTAEEFGFNSRKGKDIFIFIVSSRQVLWIV